MFISLSHLFEEVVDDCPKPTKQIAAEVHKSYSTLKRELNSFDEQAKLGADLVLPLMVACEDSRPLEYLAASLARTVSGNLTGDALDLPPDELSFQIIGAAADYIEASRALPYTSLQPYIDRLYTLVDSLFIARREEQEQGPCAGISFSLGRAKR